MFEQIRMCKSSNPLCQISWGRTFGSCPCIICPALLGLRSPRQGAKKQLLKHISRETEVSLQCTAVFLEDKRHSLFARYFAVKTATAVTGLLLKRLASFAGCLGAGQGWQRKLKLLMTGYDRLSFSTCGMFETEPTKLWQRYAFPCVPALFCV